MAFSAMFGKSKSDKRTGSRSTSRESSCSPLRQCTSEPDISQLYENTRVDPVAYFDSLDIRNKTVLLEYLTQKHITVPLLPALNDWPSSISLVAPLTSYTSHRREIRDRNPTTPNPFIQNTDSSSQDSSVQTIVQTNATASPQENISNNILTSNTLHTSKSLLTTAD